MTSRGARLKNLELATFSNNTIDLVLVFIVCFTQVSRLEVGALDRFFYISLFLLLFFVIQVPGNLPADFWSELQMSSCGARHEKPVSVR